MKLDFYSDPGHGWLCVPLELLNWMGLLDQITTYSYMRGGNAYLEEDRDASTFIGACKAMGIPLTFRERVCRERYSRIRNYPFYTPDLARRNINNGRTWRPAWKPPKVLTPPAEAVL